MSAPTIRSDYDGLKQVAQGFQQNGDQVQQINKQLKSNLQTLEGGDWQGLGATAFLAEMNGQVMPSMDRLSKALVEAARVTKQISAAMKAAEQESSSCFHFTS